MIQLDSRPNFLFERLGETKSICKSADMPVLIELKSFRNLIDKEDLDAIAQEILEDQHRWSDLADANLKVILEWGIDFPFVKKIGLP